MLVTFLIRICGFIGLCSVPQQRETVLNVEHLNSFSSKTAYRNSRMDELNDRSVDYLANCELVQMNAVFRHGTRFPSTKDMDRMEEVHRKMMSSNARSILPAAFQRWQLPFTRGREKELASVGYEEMMLLGARFRARLAAAAGDADGHGKGDGPITKRVKVFSSSLSRSKLSAATFLRSFLNESSKSVKEVAKLITENDKFLRFFDNCPHYTTTVLKNKASKMEYIRFKNGPEVKRLIRDLQQKWKLTDISLTPDDVRVLYAMCAYEIATNLSSYMKSSHSCPPSPAGDGLTLCPQQHQFKAVQSSPLCSLLDPDQYAVLEYIYDLKHYWVKSYGKEINWLQACGLMSPLLQTIMDAARGHQAAKRSTSTPVHSHLPFRRPNVDQQAFLRASFWFGHAETLLPVISLLGLFNQTTPLTAKTFAHRMALINDRKQRFSTFRAANIVPFSGNLALDLYHCPNLAKDSLSGYRIQARVNEKAIGWPLANGHSHISLELLMKHLNLCLADKYDHNAICIRGLSAVQLHEVRKRSDEL